MSRDFAPEELDATNLASATLSLDEAVLRMDVDAQPGPEDVADDLLESVERATKRYENVQWPISDEQAPDYRYLAGEPDPATFALTPAVLEGLISANRYAPVRNHNIIAFALRGARLLSGDEVEMVDTVELENVRPNHREFRCVVGFYFTDRQKLTVYTGSTVPCRLAVYENRVGIRRSNLLPTGLHTYYIWRHKSLSPALRLAHSRSNLELGARATVLRNRQNDQLDINDIFDYSRPYDNVHCSYYLTEAAALGASFSSWGCLTVRGRKDPSDQWEKFQQVLSGVGAKERVDLLLATGKDAAVASTNLGDPQALSDRLTALRAGSRGPEVERLQLQLGLEPSGYYGALTLDKFTGAQRAHAGMADGILTPSLDAELGWGVFHARMNS